MKVKQLIKKLEKMPHNMEVVIDFDENGWYSIEAVEEVEDSSGYRAVNVVNIASSSEA